MLNHLPQQKPTETSEIDSRRFKSGRATQAEGRRPLQQQSQKEVSNGLGEEKTLSVSVSVEIEVNE